MRFTATGASMAPAIRNGDVLHVEPVEAVAISLEDVVLYASARGLTAHRVVALPDQAGTLRCRGDAVGSEVERVDAGQVLGRVAAVDAAGGPRFAGARRLVERLKAWAREILPLGEGEVRPIDPPVTNLDLGSDPRMGGNGPRVT